MSMGPVEYAIQAPDSDLPRLSFCDGDPKAIAGWVAELPMANTQETARQLHKATDEVARLQVAGNLRLECLEALRPTLLYLCLRLDRTAQGQPHLNNGPARAAQLLQVALVDGYKSTIRDLLHERLDDKVRLGLALAIHRAITDLSRILLRAYQYYTSLSAGTWRELHQLYVLAEGLDLHDRSFSDEDNEHTSLNIEQSYLRALLLASANPNRMRPRHLSLLFQALEAWLGKVALMPDTRDCELVVDMEADAPPCFKRLLTASRASCRGIYTARLVQALDAWLREEDTDLEVTDDLPQTVLQQVTQCWGSMRQRSFRRLPAGGRMKVCVGLRTAHFYLSGGVEFAEQLGSTRALLRRELNPFLDPASEQRQTARPQPVSDPWAQAIDAGPMRIPENPNIEDPSRVLLSRKDAKRQTDLAEDYPCHDADIVDTSPAGYGLRWVGEFPAQLLSGELLAIREADDQNWCIADCRWIRHETAHSILGVELLAPQAIPVAVRRIEKLSTQREYSRALLSPALEAIKQPAMLIVPLVGFAEQQKVQMRHQGQQSTAQLLRQVRVTESYTQFTFRMLDGYLETQGDNRSMEELWNAISGGSKPSR